MHSFANSLTAGLGLILPCHCTCGLCMPTCPAHLQVERSPDSAVSCSSTGECNHTFNYVIL